MENSAKHNKAVRTRHFKRPDFHGSWFSLKCKQ